LEGFTGSPTTATHPTAGPAARKPKHYDAVITFVKATGLKAADIDGNSDPLFKATLNNETHKSVAIQNTLNPVWNEKWAVKNITSGMKLTIELFDEDIFSNDNLGKAEYTFTETEICDKEREQIVEVLDNGKKQGTMTLSFLLKRKAYDVDVTFVKGNGLSSSDIGGKSDPYIKAKFHGQDHQTPVISNNLNPEWNGKWHLGNVPAGSKLEMTLWDKDTMTQDDPLGHAEYTLEEDEAIGKKKTVTVKVSLNNKDAGTVTLDFLFNVPAAAPAGKK